MRERGFTLLELLIALAIVGALVTILLGGLRVGLAAWRQGENRAEAHQHLRSLSELVARSVSGAFPYRHRDREGGEPEVLFQGDERRLSFVTLSPPFPLKAPVAFTAVTLAEGEAPEPGLVIHQKALPNFEPFEDTDPLFVDGAVTSLAFRYLRPGGGWETRWDGEEEEEIPEAIQIQLVATLDGRTETLPPLTISTPARTP